MISLNKQQVKAVLDVMSNDDSRQALCQAWIEVVDSNPYLITTDSYHAVLFKLPDAASEQAGKVITREDLTRFYKLMERKDLLTTEWIIENLKDTDYTPPKMAMVLEGVPSEGSTETIAFNATLALNLQKIAADGCLFYRTTGRRDPMQAEYEGNRFILMPMK